MKEIALHLLDIAENSVAAQAHQIDLRVEENLVTDRLLLSVQDDGKGMDAEMLAMVADPFVTTRTTRKVGLGIPLFKAAAESCNGNLTLYSGPGQGTRLEADFQRSHIDRMPLGDLAGTLLTLVVSYPEVHWTLHYFAHLPPPAEEVEFFFDDQPIKEELKDCPLCEPEVLSFLRAYLEQGIAQVREALPK